jgi:hypothetical protein
MRIWGRSMLSEEKITKVIHSASQTLGQPCLESERRFFQALAEEMRLRRRQLKQAKLALETIIKSDPELEEIGALIGLVTTFLASKRSPRPTYHKDFAGFRMTAMTVLFLALGFTLFSYQAFTIG